MKDTTRRAWKNIQKVSTDYRAQKESIEDWGLADKEPNLP